MTFGGDAYFSDATFSLDADFSDATFNGDADFGGATFSGDAGFGGATFKNAQQFGPLVVGGRTLFDRAVFERWVKIELSSRIVSSSRALFRGGADVLVRWAEVSLDDAAFAAPSLVAVVPFPPRREAEALGSEEPLGELPPAARVELGMPAGNPAVRAGTWACRLVLDKRGRPVRPDDPQDEFAPRVLSLQGAKVAELTMSGVDVRECRFVGAHGLDELNLERARLAYPPAGWRRLRWWRWVRWTRRQTVAEERKWRQLHHYGAAWYPEDEGLAPDALGDASHPPDPQQIATVYRALRKGREDSKDEPGAADFYYGEMEMRRHSTRDARSRPIVSIVAVLAHFGLRAAGQPCVDRLGDHDRARRPLLRPVRLRRWQASR